MMDAGRWWRRALRGYWPLVGTSMAFVAMVAIVPIGTGSGPGAGAALAPVTENQVVTGADSVAPCAGGRVLQIDNDPYSPPCFEWTGSDNGGETTHGVTADTITVSYRNSDSIAAMAAGMQSSLPTGASVDPGAMSPERMVSTIEALVEYVNRNFQLYGRRIKLVPFRATGDPLGELTGAGQQQAEADARTVAEEIGAFADVTGTPSLPYASALASKRVLSLAAPSPSDEYFAERRPYAWGNMPSCTTTARASSEMLARSLAGRPARFAGDPARQRRTRTFAIVTPEGREYQNCVAAALDVLRAAGADAITLSYKLDFANMATAAEDVLNRLVADNITTVACSCDPLLPMYLTKSATKVGYRPEWVLTGSAMADSDRLSQLYDQSQWAHAFGITIMGRPLPATESPAYRAFKSVRPNEEPTPVVDSVYYQLYLLAIGIQMAGPQLSPESFERGMFAYPEHTGPGGTWKFEPGTYTPQRSATVLWWDATGSSANGSKGTYRYAERSYRIGQAPRGEPDVFMP